MKKLAAIVLTLCMILGLSLVFNFNSYAKPGDESDPVIVLSYLNMRLDELVSKYNLNADNNLTSDISTENIQNSINAINMKLDELSTSVANLNESSSQNSNKEDQSEISNETTTNTSTENSDTNTNDDITSKDKDEASTQNSYLKYAIVELQAGEKLLAEESSEIIVRMGNCTAIASANGGLSDVTSGKNLSNLEKVDLNHLIIIPRTDGRGLLANDNTIIMIKGDYEIISIPGENSDLTNLSSDSDTKNDTNKTSDSSENDNTNNESE